VNIRTVNIRTPHRRVAIVALLSIVTMVGCDTPDQPINPTDSTVDERRPDEVPEGNVVPPVGSVETPSSVEMIPPATSTGG
jgi:hypothetical protein